MTDATPLLAIEVAFSHAAAVAALSAYTRYIEQGVVDPYVIVRGPVTTGVPGVLALNRQGIREREWDQIFFGVILVIPRVKDLGAVISSTSYPVEVWNADDAPHLAQGVTISGSSGVTISGGPTLPAFWPPFSSYFITVAVDGNGDAIVDTTIAWLFPGFTGTDHRVLGFRITVLPLEPDLDESPFAEAVGVLCSVFQSRDGTEQRRALQSKPQRQIACTNFAFDGKVAGENLVKLYTGGDFLFGIPYWPDATPLTSDLAGGETVIPVATAGTIFTAGGLLLLRTGARTWQAFTIAAGGVSGSAITVTSPVVGAWRASAAVVIPVLAARPDAPPKITHPVPGMAALSGSFTTEPL